MFRNRVGENVSIWSNPVLLDKLERQRNRLKDGGKLMTFDCMNTLVIGERVLCKEGKLLGQSIDGSIALITILRGITPGACKNCEYFVKDD